MSFGGNIKKSILLPAVLFLTILLSAHTVFGINSSTLLPNSDGTYRQWTSKSGSTHFTNIDETKCNGTTDYVSTNTTGSRDSYVVPLSSIPNSSIITRIDIAPCASKIHNGGSVSVMDVFYRFNGSNSPDLGHYALSNNKPSPQVATPFSDLSLMKNSLSNLEIGALYASGNKGVLLSNISAIITYTPLNAPANLTVAPSGISKVDLTWTDTSTIEDGFKVERSKDGGPFMGLSTLAANTQSYSDTNLQAGNYIYRVKAFNSGGYSAYATSATVTPNNADSIWFEAEQAFSISSPMQISADANASGGQYVSVPQGAGFSDGTRGGAVAYNFTAAHSGNYIIWGRVVAPSGNDDSFYVQLDGGTKYWWGLKNGLSWKWDRVNGVGVSDPIVFPLTAGSHTLEISWREDGSKLDRILITDASWLLPSLDEQIDPLAAVWSGSNPAFDLLTTANQQFVAYYDTERWLTVASRDIGSGQWQYQRLDDQFGGWDSHNYITMVVDNDGQLHVTGDMHTVPLKYWRTTTPGNIATLARQPCMVCGDVANENKVTYPQFFKGPANELLFTYRQGISGEGENFINEYDHSSQTWHRFLASPLFSYPANQTMNAYPQPIIRDNSGLYHLTWVWRDTPDVTTNHDLSYAQSTDLKTWKTSTGQTLTLPLTIENAQIVDPVPVNGGLGNNPYPRLGFDNQDRPVLTYHKYDSNGNSQVYNARLEQGDWRIYQTSNWACRWDIAGTGSLSQGTTSVNIGAIRRELDGGLSQSYRSCDGFSGYWKLDESTMLPVGSYPPYDDIPVEISETDPLVSSICGFSDLNKMTIVGRGDSPDSNRYFLRWTTLGANRDQPRTNCSSPEPMKLRLYKLADF